MKAMILAAGLGTRMGELTRDLPKPLVPVAGRPMLLYAVDNLKRAGVTDLVINTHYKSELLQEFVADQCQFGIQVTLSHEPELLDTGGGILNARAYLEDVDFFLVHNADVYSEIDLAQLVAEHCASGALATLALKDRNTTRGLLFTSALELCGWEHRGKGQRVLTESTPETRPVESYGFCGVQVMSREFLSFIARDNKKRFSLIDVYLAAVSAGHKIVGFDIGTTAWFDMGSAEKIAEVEAFLAV